MEKGGKKGKALPGCIRGYGDVWGNKVSWACANNVAQINVPMPPQPAPREARINRDEYLRFVNDFLNNGVDRRP